LFPAGSGVIAAIGWSGFWEAEFVREPDGQVKVQAGMPDAKLVLRPGEEIRTPRILLMFWQGDRIDAQNKWRRLLLDHYSPRPGGKPVKVPLSGAVWGALAASQQIERIRWYRDSKLPIDCYWIDAGWSGKTGPIESWVENAAVRVPNPDYYPHGLKPVSDEAHKYGMKFLLWTWPNRALPNVGVGKQHPEWLVGDVIDHGNPEANKWMIEENIKLIEEQGLDIWRQDGNPVYPADSVPDRDGINQIRHFEGSYEFWDALLKRYPNLMIDNCSGGGRKIDLETISRSVCLWRSDYQVAEPFDPIGMQGQTYGLSFWVPLSAGCTRHTDSYSFRSGYSPGMVLGYCGYASSDYKETFNYEQGRREMNTYISVRSCFYGDYYPLTPYSLSGDAWMAWQFDRPEVGEGVVQAFRRPECKEDSIRLKLRGLDSEARYCVRNVDDEKDVTMTGGELMGPGLLVTIPDKPGAAVITYKKD